MGKHAGPYTASIIRKEREAYNLAEYHRNYSPVANIHSKIGEHVRRSYPTLDYVWRRCMNREELETRIYLRKRDAIEFHRRALYGPIRER